MIAAFEFTSDGRDYRCQVQERKNGQDRTAWWWFDVSGDRSRYAPFLAEPDDTESSVRERIVAYYDGVVERRGIPFSRFPR